MASTIAQDRDSQTTMRQLDSLLQDVDAIADPAARSKIGEILQGLMEFHGAGLAAILDRFEQFGDAGHAAVLDLAEDKLVASLLVLYGLHPLDLESRVKSALKSVRPLLLSHGGNVELQGITEDGVVRLSMQGSCHGCPSSEITLKSTIEQAIYDAAPDVAGIQVQGATEPPRAAPANLVSIECLVGSLAEHRH
jgi:Fe-S cluster biogenesis protein NfuA